VKETAAQALERIAWEYGLDVESGGAVIIDQLASAGFHVVSTSSPSLPPCTEIVERLREIIMAWESLPEGFHSRNEVQNWLNYTMKPAIEGARAALAEDTRVDRSRCGPQSAG
jgi:hypothetical protein